MELIVRPVNREARLLRELAKQVQAISAADKYDLRRDLWRRHNSLDQSVQPLVNTRYYNCWQEIFPDSRLTCADPELRGYERFLRQMIFQDSLGDDSIIEPWITVSAVHKGPCGRMRWGLDLMQTSDIVPGTFHYSPVIRAPEDISVLQTPFHLIDEARTSEKAAKLSSILEDILPVHVDRSPVLLNYTGDISTDLGLLLGLENLMYDVFDHPEWLHALLRFMRDSILKLHSEAEAAADWNLGSGYNQSMPYSCELPDPGEHVFGVKRNQLWAYMSSQEFTAISPEMFNEFLFEYQKPILEHFGLVSYGCCENLTGKIKYLRRLPNLRRISVTPWADLRSCAEQIGQDYVISWRPSPAEMILDFDEERVRKILRRSFDVLDENHCLYDVALKDIETIQGNPAVLKRWTGVAKEEISSRIGL
jgi:hypothetical protein